MDIKKIQAADVRGKKVLLRVAFDVPIEKGTIKDKFKVSSCEETLHYLLGMNARVALLTYLGRPGGEKKPEFSLNQIKDDIGNIFGCQVKFVADCIGEDVKKTVEELKAGEVALLENVRFYSEEGDVEKGTAYDEDFAKKLADGFDIFVNDAFSQSHRDQASITGVSKLLPSYAGFWMQKEIDELEKVKNNPEHPAVAIIGGAKIETKLPVIKLFEEKYDHVLIGGKIANEALKQKMVFSQKVLLPTDFIDDRMDIGKETLARYKEIIEKAKTIVWNGPTGKFEEEKYATSTNEILRSILDNKDAYALIGGGDTLDVVEKNNVLEEIQKRGFVSTGGGAMLDFLGGHPMPGIDILKV